MLDGLGTGQRLLADRGYDGDAQSARLASQCAWENIKPNAQSAELHIALKASRQAA